LQGRWIGRDSIGAAPPVHSSMWITPHKVY
jgi:hypothetical protein